MSNIDGKRQNIYILFILTLERELLVSKESSMYSLATVEDFLPPCRLIIVKFAPPSISQPTEER